MCRLNGQGKATQFFDGGDAVMIADSDVEMLSFQISSVVEVGFDDRHILIRPSWVSRLNRAS